MMRVLVSYSDGHRKGLVPGWTPYGAGEPVPDAEAALLAVSARSHGAQVRLEAVSTGSDPSLPLPPPAAPGMLGLWSR